MFRLQRLACRSANRRLLGAGGLFSVAGVTWCLNIAFDKHPKAAIKACLAGALSICLTKSVIFGVSKYLRSIGVFGGNTKEEKNNREKSTSEEYL
ncbi:hypothetical protein AVEN_229139-1 [Araneus ventricosus]|uniref:Uncharacterized protein n=1 Tax=Araneus ventricosus TaxID=182803 RepID=A0A4Y2V091_ARAVE|nr:hypothetical protein AVEN_229139-1 [Araneus ventricosus]